MRSRDPDLWDEFFEDDPVDLSHALSTGQWARLGPALSNFDRVTRQRGAAYAREGRVQGLKVEGTTIAAVVLGERPYDVAWTDSGRAWSARCSCPVGLQCKHAYAVGLALMSAVAELEPEPAPPVSRRGPSPLHALQTATMPWQVDGAVLQLLLQDRINLQPHQLPLVQLAAERDPELRCWQLARAIVAHPGGRLPSALEPYWPRTDLAERIAQRERERLANDLAAWAATSKTPPARQLRIVLTLRRFPGDHAGVAIEARLTTPRLQDASRTDQQIAQLRSEALRTPGAFPPAQVAVLDWLADRRLGGRQGEYRSWLSPSTIDQLLGLQSDPPLIVWGEELDPVLATRAGITTGQPVRRGGQAVQLAPDCVLRDGEPWLVLSVLWPDGRRQAYEDVVHVDQAAAYPGHAGASTSWLLSEGAFVAVAAAPPAPLVTQFRATGGLPLPTPRRVPLLRSLGRTFPHLLATLQQHTHIHPATPVFLLETHDDTWLQLRLLAGPRAWRPGDPPAEAVFEYDPREGWTRARAPVASTDRAVLVVGGSATAPLNPSPEAAGASPPPLDVWTEEPDPALVGPATDWLTSTRALPGTSPPATWTASPPEPANREGWWILLNPKRLEQLAERFADRPEGARFYGSERVRRLLAPRAVTPRVQITASGIDWFSVSAEWAAEGLALSEEDVTALRSAKARFIRLSTGWVDRQATATHDRAAAVLADLGVEAGVGPTRVSLWQLAGARHESLAEIEALGVDDATREALAAMRRRIAAFSGLPAIAVPTSCTATLRPYQQHGVDFLAWTASLGLGAILADDMGLGKTVQALAWLAHLRATDPALPPALVVCPASVVHNWVRETERFLPAWRVLVLAGGAARHALRAAVAQHDLVVTNYALLRRDVEQWAETTLGAVIFDEAQHVKNPDAAVTHAARRIQARHRLALTGTPLENRALDLWSLMSVVNPGHLGGRQQFVGLYDRPDAPPHRRALLAARLRPVMLRRLKQEVAKDLPDRIEERRDCELSAEQRRLYLAELRRSRKLVTAGGTGRDAGKQRIQILAALTRLRQICCHPALAGGSAGQPSGKFDALFELLEPLLAEGHKVLVFSQFVECLKLLSAELIARDVPHHRLTGATTKREQVVAGFVEDPRPCVFLVSLRAGGTGLNLTAASYVVLFDPWWNPAVEAQAIDRTHRIGQDRTVVAYRLVARDTIEEKILALQERKAELVRDVLGESGFGRALTRDDLEYLFASEE